MRSFRLSMTPVLAMALSFACSVSQAQAMDFKILQPLSDKPMEVKEIGDTPRRLLPAVDNGNRALGQPAQRRFQAGADGAVGKCGHLRHRFARRHPRGPGQGSGQVFRAVRRQAGTGIERRQGDRGFQPGARFHQGRPAHHHRAGGNRGRQGGRRAEGGNPRPANARALRRGVEPPRQGRASR